MWFAWLGWDDEYYLVDDVYQGPYRAWQVIGCGVSVVVATLAVFIVVGKYRALMLWVFASIAGFAIPWSIDAEATDDSGLWVIGLMTLLIGGVCGLLVVLATAGGVRSQRAHRTQGRQTSQPVSRDEQSS